MIVPDNTIVYYPITTERKSFDMNVSKFLKPLNEDHTREWFTPEFYKCLPLSIANMQGFAFYSPFDFEVIWNGGSTRNDVTVKTFAPNEYDDYDNVFVNSWFGHGTFTFSLPIIFKTPPGINLLTIAPPNYPTPGISPMSGFIETDNLKYTFTLNFKIDVPNIPVRVLKNYPIMGILPIPRYFCDSFELVNAYDIFSEEEINKEKDIADRHGKDRRKANDSKENGYNDRTYFRGMDFDKNKFKDHQLPKKKKKK